MSLLSLQNSESTQHLGQRYCSYRPSPLRWGRAHQARHTRPWVDEAGNPSAVWTPSRPATGEILVSESRPLCPKIPTTNNPPVSTSFVLPTSPAAAKQCPCAVTHSSDVKFNGTSSLEQCDNVHSGSTAVVRECVCCLSAGPVCRPVSQNQPQIIIHFSPHQ